MRRLLETESVVPRLESHRHGANYFLESLIGAIRHKSQELHRVDGLVPVSPLDSLSREEFESALRDALLRSGEALTIFLRDLVQIENFELEVIHQRRRLQFLLGCDRVLRDIAESNAEIIDSSAQKFGEIVSRFFDVCGTVRTRLRPLLTMESPFERLRIELEGAREQLEDIVSESPRSAGRAAS